MDRDELMKTIRENLERTANIKAVFGEPSTHGDVTIIPVARTKISGGGGGGQGEDESDATKPAQKGSGLGIGIRVSTTPVGYIRIQDNEAEFVPIMDNSKLAMAGIVAGGVLVMALASAMRR